MIRVLQIFHDMSNGGIERFIMNYYRRIDRNEIQFDFLTSVDESGYFDDEIRSLGGALFHAHPFEKNPVRHYFDVARIVRQNNFQIVYRHTGGAFGYFDLRAARRGGARNLILHAHSANAGKPLVHELANRLLKIECRRFACSQRAGEFLFGSNARFDVVHNAIDVRRFIFCPETRNRLRRELGLDHRFVVGHVGSFQKVKNQQKALSVFAEIHKRQRESALVFVGTGPTINEIKELAQKFGLEKNVLFLGMRDDVEKVVQTFDAFLFPSLSEGLGMALIEAQANGLKCFASKDVIPAETNVTGNVRFIPLTASDSEWASVILQSNMTRDVSALEKVKNSGYDISVEAFKMQSAFLSMINGQDGY